jgi:hypothetical protein
VSTVRLSKIAQTFLIITKHTSEKPLKSNSRKKNKSRMCFSLLSTLSLKHVYGKSVFTLFVNIPFLESLGKTIKVRS